MTLAFLIAAMTFVVLVAMLRPLWRDRPEAVDTMDREQIVHRDQLREVDRDLEQGLVTAAEAASLRLEVQRRLLSSADRIEVPLSGKPHRVLAAAIGIATAGGAIGLYVFLSVPMMPPAAGPDARTNAMLIQLSDGIVKHPDDADAWSRYAAGMSQLSRWNDAEIAWRKVIALGQSTPEVLASLGEALVFRSGGTVNDEARGLFDMAARGEQPNEMARYYLALAMSQRGDPKGAVTAWRTLLDDMAPDSPGRPDVTRQIEETSRAAGIAEPRAEERIAMIEGMVAKLAARLAEHPDDAEGWSRLGRSYAVLERHEAAADAYERAADLRPDDPRLKLAAALALLAGLRPEDPLPPRSIALLRQIETKLPEEPAVLWYLGLAAARDRDAEHARGYWTRLSKIMPPDSADANMIRDALNALNGVK